MAIKKTIIIDTQVDDSEVKNLKSSLKEVDTQAQKTSKSVDDVAGNGGAIAILDQLTGGLATRFKDAYEASKLFNTSLRATRGALIATGIGALVVALGTIIILWDDIIDAIENVNGKLQEQIDLSLRVQETLKLELDILDKKIKLSEKEGKVNEELQKQRIELVKQLRAENDEEIKKLGLQAENLKVTALELNTREKILKTVLNTLAAGSGDQFILDKQLESLKQYQDIQDAILKAKGEQVDLDIKLFELENVKPKEDKEDKEDKKDKSKEELENQRLLELEEKRKTLQSIEDLENEFLESKLDKQQLELNAVREKYFGIIEAAREAGEETLILEEAQQSAIDAVKKKYADIQDARDKKEKDEEKKRDEAVANARISTANTTANLIAELAGKESAVAKGVAVAQTTIDTYKGATSAYSSLAGIPIVGPALGAVAAGAAIASGVANVKKILSTDPISKSGQTAIVGASTSQPSAPSFNLVQGTGTNQIAESIGNQNRPIQAYVVSGSVTSAQELDRNIIESSTI